jgi:peptide chain release factor subunit 1
MPTTDQLTAQLDRVASTDTGPYPVISLYLDLRPNEHGRDQFEPFLRKELADRVHTYPASGPERASLDADAARIREYVTGLDGSVNGLALFASHGAGLFEPIALAAPIDAHRLYISDQPHLYPLARVIDEYPRYLALLTDTHSARIFVFATNAIEKTEQIQGEKTKHHKKGGWSQARYQRHVENFHLQHAKEVADAVARLVREEAIDKVFISADDVVMPLLREHLPKEVSDRIVDVLKMDVRAPEHEVLESTLAALRQKDAETDRERVDELIGAYRANGLACVGVDATRKAFELGQVDELLITAVPNALKAKETSAAAGNQDVGERTPQERLADELIVQARNTSAKIRFIEDPALLGPFGGVGAFLRFKV